MQDNHSSSSEQGKVKLVERIVRINVCLSIVCRGPVASSYTANFARDFFITSIEITSRLTRC